MSYLDERRSITIIFTNKIMKNLVNSRKALNI